VNRKAAWIQAAFFVKSPSVDTDSTGLGLFGGFGLCWQGRVVVTAGDSQDSPQHGRCDGYPAEHQQCNYRYKAHQCLLRPFGLTHFVFPDSV
ncbi:hypothetical protein NTD90_24825, partial [Pseudomonas sp. 20S_6.2_Bac1]